MEKRIIPLGYLRTEDGVFHRMEGTLDVPVEDHTYLYLQCMLTPYPDIFERFGKDNISGLEIVTFKVPEVLASLKGAVGLTICLCSIRSSALTVLIVQRCSKSMCRCLIR